MANLTQTMNSIEAGDLKAVADLLPPVYDELRRLAAACAAFEAPGNSLNPTALVHEAYIRLVGPADTARWVSRGHFFAAAAEAMRRILIDHARAKWADKRGGYALRHQLDPDRLAAQIPDPDQWLDLDHALTRFEAIDPAAAALAKLRVFAGLAVEEAGSALGIPRATAFRHWTYARAWLTARLSRPPAPQSADS